MPHPFALAAAAAAGALLATLLTRHQRDAPRSPNVRHVVLVQLKPETPAAAIDAMLAALRRLPAQIPTILRLEVGRQLASLDDNARSLALAPGGSIDLQATYVPLNKLAAQDPNKLLAQIGSWVPAQTARIGIATRRSAASSSSRRKATTRRTRPTRRTWPRSRTSSCRTWSTGGARRCRSLLTTTCGSLRRGRAARRRGAAGNGSRSRCASTRRGWSSSTWTRILFGRRRGIDARTEPSSLAASGGTSASGRRCKRRSCGAGGTTILYFAAATAARSGSSRATRPPTNAARAWRGSP